MLASLLRHGGACAVAFQVRITCEPNRRVPLYGLRPDKNPVIGRKVATLWRARLGNAIFGMHESSINNLLMVRPSDLLIRPAFLRR